MMMVIMYEIYSHSIRMHFLDFFLCVQIDGILICDTLH